MQTTVSTPPDVAMPEAVALVKADSDANEALMLLFRVHRSFSRALTDHIQDALGVSATQARVLLCLDGSASIACTDLARRLGWDSSHISRLVPVLEKKNLITSRRCTIDRRTVLLSLTAAGAALAARVPAVLHESEQAILGVFDDRERERLRGLLCRAAVHGEPSVRDGAACARPAVHSLTSTTIERGSSADARRGANASAVSPEPARRPRVRSQTA